jgi:hypothetical protein
MKHFFILLILTLTIFNLIGQNTTATVILKTGDTLDLVNFSKDETYITGTIEKTNRFIKVANTVVISIVEGCNYEQNEIDDMTGQRIKRSKSISLTNYLGSVLKLSAHLQVASLQVNNQRFLKFKLNDSSIFSMDAGAKILIKCQNEKIYELINLQYLIADGTYVSQYSSNWSAEITTSIDQDVLKELSSCIVTKIRFYLNKGYLDIEVSPSLSTNLQSVLKCIE